MKNKVESSANGNIASVQEMAIMAKCAIDIKSHSMKREFKPAEPVCENDLIKINIRGRVFEVSSRTVARHPDTRLYNLDVSDPNYLHTRECWFFSR